MREVLFIDSIEEKQRYFRCTDGNAFSQGFQAAALKPGDFFGNDDILYLMEDMATGEIRMSILWEWVHKGAVITEDHNFGGVHELSPTFVSFFISGLA